MAVVDCPALREMVGGAVSLPPVAPPPIPGLAEAAAAASMLPQGGAKPAREGSAEEFEADGDDDPDRRGDRWADEGEPPPDRGDPEGGGGAGDERRGPRTEEERRGPRTEEERRGPRTETPAGGGDAGGDPAVPPGTEGMRAWADQEAARQAGPFPPFDPEALPRTIEPPFGGETAGALAVIAATSATLQEMAGVGLGQMRGVLEMAETIESFADCVSGLALPPRTEALPALGSIGQMVATVRERTGIDLLRRDAGADLADRLREMAEEPPPEAVPEPAARRVNGWAALKLCADALGLPTTGPGALQKVGETVRFIAGMQVPDPGPPEKVLEVLSRAKAVQDIREGLQVDPLARGAADAIRERVERVRANMDAARGALEGVRTQATAAASLSRQAVDMAKKVDRTQWRDLGIEKVRQVGSPVMEKAAPVMQTLKTVSDMRGRSVTRPGSGRPRSAR
jgi:hypothetical protein